MEAGRPAARHQYAPNQLYLEIAAGRGALFPCQVCGKACKAHDFAEFTWRHLNFFQHHCYVTAHVPHTDYGVLRINVPWAREGSRFAIMLVREMPVLAAGAHHRHHRSAPVAHRRATA